MYTFAKQILKLFMAGIYLHIPFCTSRCSYCDFYSSTQTHWTNTYIDALCKELNVRSHYMKEETIDTIYIGGGTPSLLNSKQLSKIFNTIYNIYKVDNHAEITLEANPDDLTIPYIKTLHSLPINRLSIGIQTFQEERLLFSKRRHTATQASEAVKNCQNEGFKNISIDLIYGWPKQSLTEWEKDIEQAINLNIQHLSAYHLTYEEGTHLWYLRKQGAIQDIDEESSLLLYSTLIKKMQENRFEHYEISNFCKPGMHSRHNSSYWQGIPYLGCGAAAHSYNKNSRQWNVASIEQYVKGIENNEPIYEREELDLYTRYNDYVITRMRTKWGINLQETKLEFGKELENYCLRMAQPYISNNKIELRGEQLRLTSKGIFVSDGIISDLLWV